MPAKKTPAQCLQVSDGGPAFLTVINPLDSGSIGHWMTWSAVLVLRTAYFSIPAQLLLGYPDLSTQPVALGIAVEIRRARWPPRILDTGFTTIIRRNGKGVRQSQPLATGVHPPSIDLETSTALELPRDRLSLPVDRPASAVSTTRNRVKSNHAVTQTAHCIKHQDIKRLGPTALNDEDNSSSNNTASDVKCDATQGTHNASVGVSDWLPQNLSNSSSIPGQVHEK